MVIFEHDWWTTTCMYYTQPTSVGDWIFGGGVEAGTKIQRKPRWTSHWAYYLQKTGVYLRLVVHTGGLNVIIEVYVLIIFY